MITKDQIKEAIAKVQADGWTVESGMWYSSNKICCPLTAVYIASAGEPPDSKEPWQEIAEITGMTRDEVFRFVDGYDSGRATLGETDAHRMGREIRNGE
jgi:hypothetical protein